MKHCKDPLTLSDLARALGDDRIRNVKLLHITTKLQAGEFSSFIPRFTNLETLKILTCKEDFEEVPVPTKEFHSLVALSSSLRHLGVYGREFDLSVLPLLVNLEILQFWNLPVEGSVVSLLDAACICKKLHTLCIDDDPDILAEPISQDTLERLFECCPFLVNIRILDRVPSGAWPFLMSRPLLEHFDSGMMRASLLFLFARRSLYGLGAQIFHFKMFIQLFSQRLKKILARNFRKILSGGWNWILAFFQRIFGC